MNKTAVIRVSDDNCLFIDSFSVGSFRLTGRDWYWDCAHRGRHALCPRPVTMFDISVLMRPVLMRSPTEYGPEEKRQGTDIKYFLT